MAPAVLGLGSSIAVSGTESHPTDTRITYGFALNRGRRPGMEDFHHASFQKDRHGEMIGMFGIFDGHGGPNAADYCRSSLYKNLLLHPKFPSDIAGACNDAYLETDAQYLRQESGANREDGCTAVSAILYQNRLIVANAGDSRAVLSRGGIAIAMSIDHKPNLKEERTRIEDAGGMVVWAGTWRVCGVLAVSRAFGDKPLKKYVIAKPYIQEETLNFDDEFLILASDGIWDVFTNQDAVSLVKDIASPEEAAIKLTKEAIARGSADNVSAVVVRFNK